MKKIISLLLISLLCFTPIINAQNIIEGFTKKEIKKEKTKDIDSKSTTEAKPEVFRDRLIVDVFHSFWMGVPSAVNNTKFNPGFNISAIWDFKLPNKKPIAFGVGLGVTYFSQFSDALLQIDNGWIMKYNIINSDIEYSLNRLNYINCNLPIEFRYRHKNGFKFTIGARVGLVAEVSQSYKGDNPDGSDTQVWNKSYEIFNKQNISVETYTRIGWKFVNVYYAVQLNKVFDHDAGPAIFPMSLGLSFSIF